MSYIILKKSEIISYTIEDNEATSLSLCAAAHFLRGIVRYDADDFIAWARNPQESFVQVYDMCYEMDGKVVKLSYEWSETENEEYSIPVQSFISLLEQWKTVYAQQPPKILITQDGDDYRVYAIHNDAEITRILSANSAS